MERDADMGAVTSKEFKDLEDWCKMSWWKERNAKPVTAAEMADSVRAQEPFKGTLEYTDGMLVNVAGMPYSHGSYVICHNYKVNNGAARSIVDSNMDIAMEDDLSRVYLGKFIEAMKRRGTKKVSRSKRIFTKCLQGCKVQDVLTEDMKRSRMRRVRDLLQRK